MKPKVCSILMLCQQKTFFFAVSITALLAGCATTQPDQENASDQAPIVAAMQWKGDASVKQAQGGQVTPSSAVSSKQAENVQAVSVVKPAAEQQQKQVPDAQPLPIASPVGVVAPIQGSSPPTGVKSDRTQGSLPPPPPQTSPADKKPIFPEGISVGVGRATLMKLPFPVTRVAVGDPNVADFKVVSPTELYVLGKMIGSTNMILWDRAQEPHMLDATVTIDLSPLEESLKKSVPRETDIKVSAVSGSLVLNGSVADTLAADAVLSIADAYVQNLNRYLAKASAGGAGSGGAVNALRVINLMKIRDPQQVMLEVRIAEVSKNLLDKLGIKFSAGGAITTGVGNLLQADTASGALSYLLSGSRRQTLNMFDAQKTDDLVKILAEPTIVAMSGKEGSFIAGGRKYLPTPSVVGNTPTLQAIEYGITLKFLPTVLDGGRINLQVSPEVSEPVSTDLTNFAVRKVTSTVELREGETLVIGGLLKQNVKEVIKAFPILGEIPILGLLFRSSEFQNEKTELVVVVSPSLVRGVKAAPALPTDNFVPPSRSDFFIGGALEGSAPSKGVQNAPR